MLNQLYGSNGQATIDLTQGLVAHYLLNNNGDDSYGTYDGTPIGGVDFQGDVAKFDGVDDNIDLGDLGLGSMFTNLGNFTVSGWFDTISANDTRFILTTDRSGVPIDGFGYITCTSNVIQFVSFGADPDYTCQYTFPTPLVDGKHHIVVTLKNKVIHFYIDGVLVYTTTITVDMLDTSSYTNLLLQEYHNYTSQTLFFKGVISNLRLYNDGDKNQTFIDALYAEGYYPKPLPLPTTDGLIAHYPLTGTAEDLQGAGGNESGTEYNGVSFVTDVDRGSVASFDGVDDRIGLPSLGLTYTSDWTASLWFNGQLSDELTNTLLSLGDGNFHDIRFVYADNSQTPKVAVYTYDSTWRAYFHTAAVAFNVWNNLIITFEHGVGYTITLNNATETYAQVATPTLGDLNTNIGNYERLTSHTQWFKGGISDVRIYDRVLTSTEITALYNEVDEPTDGLIAHYPLTIDARANDMWVAYDGTENGGLTYINDAEFGSVANFDGVDDDIVTNLSNGVLNQTVCVWVKRSTANSINNYHGIFNNLGGYSSLSFGDGVHYASGDLVYIIYSGGNQRLVTNVPQLDEWIHIAVQQGDVWKIFINGVLDTNGLTAMYPSGSGVFQLGMPVIDFEFLGQMKDFRAYNRLLSDVEITDIYNYEKNFRPIDIDDGLEAYYPLANNSLDNYNNQYDGIDLGGITYNGLSAVLDGVDDGVRISGWDANRLHTTITLSAIVKFDAMFDGDMAISSHLYAGVASGSLSNSGAFLGLKADGVNCYAQLNHAMLNNETYTNDNGFGLTLYVAVNRCTNVSLNAGQYYHIVGTVDGNVSKLYIDGVLVATLTTTQSIQYATTLQTRPYITLGYLYYGDVASSYYFFDGEIAKARTSSKVLSAEQVAVIYNTEKGDFI